MRKLLRHWYQRLPIIRELTEIRRLISLQRDICATRVFDFDFPSHPRYSDRKRLLAFAFQVCSQNGEDGMIREIFHRIGICDRVFVEIGVGDGTENNTGFLLSTGWTGFWIDANPKAQRAIAGRTRLAESLRTLTACVTKENISSLFRELRVPTEFDLLSLDIDQNTYHVWDSLGDFRPRVVVVEYNASIPPDVDWKVEYEPNRVWDKSHNFGAGLKTFEALGQKFGYSLVGCDFVGANAFFVRTELVGSAFAEPFTAENHYEPPRYAFSYRRGHVGSILDKSSAVNVTDRLAESTSERPATPHHRVSHRSSAS